MTLLHRLYSPPAPPPPLCGYRGECAAENSPHLIYRLSISGAIPSLPPYAFMTPSYPGSFSVTIDGSLKARRRCWLMGQSPSSPVGVIPALYCGGSGFESLPGARPSWGRVLWANAGIVPQIKSPPLPSTSFPIHESLLLTFDALYSEGLIKQHAVESYGGLEV